MPTKCPHTEHNQRKVVTVQAMKKQWNGGRAPLIPNSALDKGER